MEQFFPMGVMQYALGGLLIGIGIGGIYLITGRIAGVSSFFTAIHSWWSSAAWFHQPAPRDERIWKGVLMVGLVIGAAVFTLAFQQVFVTEVQWWRLLLGGVLVGYGTRMARGCTSGHGICGISALAPSSIAATLIFMGVAIVTAHLVFAFGVAP